MTRPVKVALFANDYPGLEVCKFLRESGEEIVRLYIPDSENQKRTEEIVTASGLSKDKVVLASKVNDPVEVSALELSQPDFIITVYWAYLLKPEILKLAKSGTVNFHPALLPINRGWYPHVHSIIDGSPTGVTLHSLSVEADRGKIWVQEAIPLLETDTAGDIYQRLQQSIIQLFKDNWEKIKTGQLKPYSQDESKAVYHKKSEVDALDVLKFDEKMSVKDVLNRLRARTFGKKSFAYFLDKNGEKIYVRIQLGYKNEFE